MAILVFFSVVVLTILTWILNKKIRSARRNKLYDIPLPLDFIRILHNKVSLYSFLPEDLKLQLHGRINIFLDEKKFIGCNDLEINDEIRVTIAANACMLLLKRDMSCFPGFTNILVYPDTYVSKQVNYDGLVQTHDESNRAGESWHRGPVVLSWADVLRGTLNHSEGHNVVLHEFAHKLDEENDTMDGLPVLRENEDYRQWAEVLSKEYESLLIRVEKGTNSVIDEYGAVSPPEFFAVATESFFEKPEKMKNSLPDLYEQLQKYYDLDPAAWRANN